MADIAIFMLDGTLDVGFNQKEFIFKKSKLILEQE